MTPPPGDGREVQNWRIEMIGLFWKVVTFAFAALVIVGCETKLSCDAGASDDAGQAEAKDAGK